MKASGAVEIEPILVQQLRILVQQQHCAAVHLLRVSALQLSQECQKKLPGKYWPNFAERNGRVSLPHKHNLVHSLLALQKFHLSLGKASRHDHLHQLVLSEKGQLLPKGAHFSQLLHPPEVLPQLRQYFLWKVGVIGSDEIVGPLSDGS